MYCKNCGAEINEGALFCGNCGMKIETEQPVYQPRPAWQVWLARIAAGIVILGVILYYWHIASGGMG